MAEDDMIKTQDGQRSSKSSNEPVKAPAPENRLIVCFDGTWMDAIAKAKPLSNVARLSHCIKSVADDGAKQIVYYRTGIGTGTSYLSRCVDGATGRGISMNITDAYSFICHNYDRGKTHIYLLGFSRGAFTVSCLARFIKDVGLLPKVGLKHLASNKRLYKQWREAMKTAKPGEEDQAPAFKKLKEDIESLSDDERPPDEEILIKAIGIWDTVSALGIPIPLQLPQPIGKSFRLVHRSIPTNVEHCYHALALDERRKHFYPVLWRGDASNCRLNMVQCWFMGRHGDVGGGNFDEKNESLGKFYSNLALTWMIANLQCLGLQFDADSVMKLLNPTGEERSLTSQGVKEDVSYQSQDTVNANKAIENMMGPMLPSTKTRDLKDRLIDVAYALMGLRRRRPGENEMCGELIHWSVGWFLKNGYGCKTSPLRNHVMIQVQEDTKDKSGKRWVEPKPLQRWMAASDPNTRIGIGEYGMSKEMDLLQSWAKRTEPPQWSATELDDMEKSHTLYCNPDLKDWMVGVEASIVSKYRMTVR